MKRICSYCRKPLGTVAPLDDDTITHGMCVPCKERFVSQWEGQSLGEYLSRYDDPVLVVNEDRRVIAVNQAMTRTMNRPAEAVKGLLGGEARICPGLGSPGLGHKHASRTATPFNCVFTDDLLTKDTPQQDPGSPWSFLRAPPLRPPRHPLLLPRQPLLRARPQ
ncbi:MAG: hypothetical protein ABI333_18945 [bacterium]